MSSVTFHKHLLSYILDFISIYTSHGRFFSLITYGKTGDHTYTTQWNLSQRKAKMLHVRGLALVSDHLSVFPSLTNLHGHLSVSELMYFRKLTVSTLWKLSYGDSNSIFLDLVFLTETWLYAQILNIRCPPQSLQLQFTQALMQRCSVFLFTSRHLLFELLNY